MIIVILNSKNEFQDVKLNKDLTKNIRIGSVLLCFSVVVTNTMTKNNLGKKELVSYYNFSGYNPLWGFVGEPGQGLRPRPLGNVAY